MRPIIAQGFALTMIASMAFAGAAHHAQALPADDGFVRDVWDRVFEGIAPVFGIVVPGECTLVRRDIIDATNQVHVHMVKVCD